VSGENTAIVRTMFETAGARLDKALEFLAPDVELHLSGTFPDLDPVYRGHQGVRDFSALFNSPWEKLELEAERFIEVDGRVLVLSRFHGIGRDGIDLRLPLAHLWTLRDGLVVRMDAFRDRQKALEAVGLSE
jgi:uncharacterized protein